MPQMMSREGFNEWLQLANPTPEDVIIHLDFLRYWAKQLQNGGDRYVEDIIDRGHEYIKKYNP